VRQVREWIEEATSTGSWRRFDDLHIDEALPDVARVSWVWEARRLFDEAATLRDELAPGFAVVLAFGLATTFKPRPPEWSSMRDFLADQDAGPPSLYLFDRSSGEYAALFSDTQSIQAPEFVGELGVTLYRQVLEEQHGEYTRSLLVVR
jgi:hypothetical protein